MPRKPAAVMDWKCQDVALLVMKHVPQDDRVGKCRLVCKAWREAADIATTELELVAKTATEALWLARLLLHRGGTLRNLHKVRATYQQELWSFEPSPRLALAAATTLQQLTAKGYTVSLRGVAGTHKLTYLDLSSGAFDITPWSAQAVQLLAQLQHLSSQDCWHVQATGGSAQMFKQCLPGAMLLPMTSLTSLCLGGRGVNNKSVAFLGHLTSLRHLELLNTPYLRREDLVPISGLSCLTLLHITHASDADMDAGLELSRLTGLAELCLVQPRSFDAAVLADLKHLSRLQVNDTYITTSKHAAASIAPLVSALEGAAYLLLLDLRGVPLSANDIMAMFSYGCQLTQLHALLLGNARYGKNQFQLPAHHQLDLASIQLLLNKLPGLKHLALVGVVKPRVVKPFLVLPQVQFFTSLAVDGADDWDATVIGTLTMLRDLELAAPSTITMSGVFHLTKLTALTRLFIAGQGHGFEGGRFVYYTSKPGAPTAHQQLLREHVQIRSLAACMLAL